MRIAVALREMFGDVPQRETAARITEYGLLTDQTTVSAWLRGRVPNLEQMEGLERCFERPLGWVYFRAGFVDVAPLVEYITQTDAVASDEALIAELTRMGFGTGRGRRRPGPKQTLTARPTTDRPTRRG